MTDGPNALLLSIQHSGAKHGTKNSPLPLKRMLQ